MTALQELTHLLNSNILNKFDTIIIGGFSEPFYKASIDGHSAEIQFTRDYFRSALHELSHWCVAGAKRRKMDDYGYWYSQDGRNQQQQNEFFKVEIKPQAIEWAFSVLCEIEFEVSVDNLNQDVDGVKAFEFSVKNQLNDLLCGGFNIRTTEVIQLISKLKKINNAISYIDHKINS
ncbi:MAG: elongation factor P hydroxylase [Marinicellaceae bacterium]